MKRYIKRHGRWAYANGCRCPRCLAAGRAYARMWRDSNIAEGRQPPEHGLSGYTNYRCRCEVCREARNAYQRAYRAAHAP